MGYLTRYKFKVLISGNNLPVIIRAISLGVASSVVNNAATNL